MGGNTQTPGSYQTSVIPNNQVISQQSGAQGNAWVDSCFMAASQPFPMSPATGTLNWVGPTNTGAAAGQTAWWMPKGDGVCLSGLYAWRFRFWTGTAPGASNIKMAVIALGVMGLTPGNVYQVDDLTFASGQRVSWILPATYAANDVGQSYVGPPSINYQFSAADATGILRYDMGVTKLR